MKAHAAAPQQRWVAFSSDNGGDGFERHAPRDPACVIGVLRQNKCSKSIVREAKHAQRLTRTFYSDSDLRGLQEERPAPIPSEGGHRFAARGTCGGVMSMILGAVGSEDGGETSGG